MGAGDGNPPAPEPRIVPLRRSGEAPAQAVRPAPFGRVSRDVAGRAAADRAVARRARGRFARVGSSLPGVSRAAVASRAQARSREWARRLPGAPGAAVVRPAPHTPRRSQRRCIRPPPRPRRGAPTPARAPQMQRSAQGAGISRPPRTSASTQSFVQGGARCYPGCLAQARRRRRRRVSCEIGAWPA
jgi:hypothetical protein